MPIKVGLIGLGYWGANYLRLLSDLRQHFKLEAVCDKNLASLREASEKYGVSVFSNYEEMFETDLEAMFIVTNPPEHFLIASRCLETGKHILIEKPLVLTGVEARYLTSLAREKNLKLMVAHTFIFNSAIREIKRMLDDNKKRD